MMLGSRAIATILAMLILAGCAATPPPVVPPPGEVAPAPVQPVPPAPPARVELPPSRPDLALFDEGVALLKSAERSGTVSAREVFSLLLKNHPQSRWRPAAEAYLYLIDTGDVLREASRKGQIMTENLLAERGRLLQENEQLKKNVRELTERQQAEAGSLAQENERLRLDLQRLKALEIELEKRERMLR
jgi:ABC-type phosphate transport system auxiliary subunit